MLGQHSLSCVFPEDAKTAQLLFEAKRNGDSKPHFIQTPAPGWSFGALNPTDASQMILGDDFMASPRNQPAH
jgi:hypothetical protein